MSLNRYSAELADSFFLPLNNSGLWLRTAAPWFVLALAAHFAKDLGLPGGGLIPFIVNGLAFGGFAVTWQRWVALGEEPGKPVAVKFGLRHLLFALVYQVMLSFESFPSMLLGPSLAAMESGKVITLAVQQVFQLLIGSMFLILPHISLYERGRGGAKLQEMVLAGGLAVGLGYVMANLPFLFISLAVVDLGTKIGGGAETQAVLTVLQFATSFAALTVSSAFFAKAWSDLRVNAKRLGEPEAEAPAEGDAPTEPKKPRRTERLQKRKR